jgi:hypothetical protein
VGLDEVAYIKIASPERNQAVSADAAYHTASKVQPRSCARVKTKGTWWERRYFQKFLILSLDGVVSFTPGTLSRGGGNTRCPVTMGLGGPQSRSGRFGEKKNLLLLPKTEAQFFCCPSRSSVTLPAELPRLTMLRNLSHFAQHHFKLATTLSTCSIGRFNSSLHVSIVENLEHRTRSKVGLPYMTNVLTCLTPQ